VFASFPFDPLKDLAPIGKIGDATLIIVAHPSLPARTLSELIAYSKQQPNGVSYGTSGIGGTPHIAGELLKLRTGAKLVHVPYKGGGQAMQDALGGNIPLVYTAVAGAATHLKSGRLVPIAVSSRERVPSLPDVPTFMESGIEDFESSSWVAILAPPNTPRPIVERLNRELNAVLATPEIVEKLGTLGITPTPGAARDARRADEGRPREVRQGGEGGGDQGRIEPNPHLPTGPRTSRSRTGSSTSSMRSPGTHCSRGNE
jgi:tripartite-type tricarboxylate transporter receptor subunit TctC